MRLAGIHPPSARTTTFGLAGLFCWGTLIVVAAAQDFSISTLTPNNAVVVDVNSLVGDDRSGLAVSSSQVFLTGDAATARFNRDTLGGGASLGAVRDGLVANLADSTVYLLGNGSTPLPSGGGTFATLIELNGSTGVPSGNVIALSTPITLTGSSASVGIFSGWNRVVVHTGTRVYRVSLPDGTVTDLGAMGVPTRTASESWAYWGVAENVGVDTYIVYVRNSTTISRTKVPSGPTTTVASFANLNDMASFTVSVAQNRWYFHHESSSQFGAFSESLGYADATFVSAPVVPTIAVQPVAVNVIAGEAASFSVSANGTGPLAYQWLKNGSPVGGATTTSYAIGVAALADAGSYSVVITNASGSVTSSVAALTITAIDADLFKIVRLTASNAVVVDPILAAGDDRGGLVATDERVFLRGDDSVGGFDLGLSGGVRLGTNNGANTSFFQYDSLVSDLRTQKAYVLADGAGALGVSGGTVTRLIEIHGSNGVPTGTVITLGTSIAMPGAGLYTANVGIFSGWGRIVLHNGTSAWSINTASGAVTDLGAMARPTRVVSESWAYWGVAEYFGGSHYLVYARDAQSIVRTRIPDGATMVISTFSNLNDLASFTVVPGLNRWYFHNETVNQFTNYANFGGEILGYADAAFLYQVAGVLTLATNAVVVPEDSSGYTQTGFVTSAPAGVVSYSLTSDNAGLFGASPSLTSGGVLSFTSAANANGIANVTVTALNSGGLAVGSGSFTITVTAVNDAPSVALATNHVVVLEDSGNSSSPGFAVFTRGPGNESGQGVSAVTVTNDNNALFSVPPAISAAGTLTFTPAANAFGSATVTVIAQDNGGTLNGGVDTSAAQNFTITVSAVNDAPVVSFSTNSVGVLEDSGAASVGGFANFTPGPLNEAAQTLAGYTVANDNGALFSVPPTLAANGTLTFTPAPNANGSATVTVIAQDSGGTTSGGVDRSTNTFTLTVTAVNDAPGIAFATNNVVVLEDIGGTSLSGFGIFSPGPASESSQSITNVVTSNNNSALFSAPPAFALDGTLTFTPATNASGSATVTVVAQDNGGTASGGVNAATNVFTLSVVPVNDRPVVAVAGNLTVLEDQGAFSSNSFVTIVSLGSAEETGQSITNYAVSSTNAALFSVAPSVDAAGTLTFTPAPNASGTALITVTAQDNGGTANGGQDTSAGVSFLITVLAVNDQPSIAFTTNNVVVLEDSGAQTNLALAAFNLGPANESGQTVTNVTTSNDNSVLFAVQPAVGTNGSLTFTPAANVNGSATVTVIAQDDGGIASGGVDRATNTFTITVSAVNDAPSVTFGTNNVVVLEDGGATSVSGFASFSPGPADEVGQTLAGYSVANNNAALFNVGPAIASDGTLAFTPAANVSGSATVTVIAQDSGGTANGGVDRVTNSFTITVNAVNDAPAIVLSTNNVVVLEDSGSQTNLAFATFLAGLANESAQTITNVIILAVTNSALFSAGPVIGTDGTLVFTTAANANGTAQMSFAVQDDGGTASGGVDTSTVATFLITVSPVNDAPTVAFTTNSVVVLEDSGSQTNLAFVTFLTGPANESGQAITNVIILAVTNSALFSTGPVIGTDGALAFTPAVNANGTALVTFSVQDDGGTANNGVDTSTIASFLITVSPVNDAPTVAFTTNSVVVLEDSGAASLSGFATFSPGPPNEASQTVTNVATSNDNNALFAVQPIVGTNGSLAFTPAANASGSALVTVIAVDNGGTLVGGEDQTTNTFTLTVAPVNDPPGFALTTNVLVVLEDAGPQSVAGFVTSITAGHANESAQTVSFAVSHDNASLFSVPPAIATNGTLTFTPAGHANGSATITVVAQDNGGTTNGGVDTSAPRTFTISLQAVNDAPSFAISPSNQTVLNLTTNVTGWGYQQVFPLAGLNARFSRVAAGQMHNLALTTNGVVVGWGGNSAGRATAPANLSDVIALSGGGSHSLALKSDGTVVAWGYNHAGQTNMPAGLSGVVAIAAGISNSLALKSDGTVVAWGSNAAGQSAVPGDLTGVVGIATGLYHSLALKSDGTVAAWGDNYYGQASVPVQATGVVAVAAGYYHSLAVRADGTVVGWGAGAGTSVFPHYGQTAIPANLTGVTAVVCGAYHSAALKGDGTVVAWGSLASRVTVPAGLTGVTAISAGFGHTLALKSDGAVVIWGDSYEGENTSPAGLSGVKAIATGFFHSLALKDDGGVVAWGFDSFGNIAVPAAAQTGVAAVAAGYGLSLALKSNGTVVAWGNNTASQVTFAATLTGIVAIASQNTHALALKGDGSVLAWGDNVSGQTNVPAGLAGVVAVAAGSRHSLALKADGTVVTWGYTAGGRLIVPADLSNVTAIAAGTMHSLALKQDGTVVAWGYGGAGQTNVPAGLSNVVAIAAKGDYCLALKNDGNLVGWGDNDFGQLSFPVGLTGVTAIAAGDVQALALFTNYQTAFSITVAEDSGAYVQPGFLTSISAGPPDEAGQTVNFLVSADTTNLFAVPPAISPNGALTFTPATNANGTATVTVRAQDDGGTANGGVDTSAPQTFTITVTPVNDVPLVTLATNHVVVLEDSGLSSRVGFAAFSPGPPDEAGQTLVSYTVVADNPAIFSVQPAISTNGTLTFTPGTNAFEGAVVTVAAQDSGGTASGGINRITNVFAISVLPVNDPPQVVLATNVVLVPPDSGTFSNGAFTTFSTGPVNEFGQSVTNVSVLGVSAPSLFDVPPALTTAGALTFTLAVGASGSATVSFVVQDDGGTANGGVDRATNSFTIAVAAANVAPVVTFSTNLVAVLEESGAVSRPGFASFSPGPGGEAGQLLLGYTVANDNAALFSVPPALNPAGTLTFTPATNAHGSTTVTVIAQDNGGTAGGGVDRATNTFTLTVLPVNDPPAFSLRLPPAQVPDNSIIGWGDGGYGQTMAPAGLSNAVAISVGNFHSLALRFDGTVVAWGYNGSGQVNVPAGLSNVVAVAAGGFHSLALRSDGTVFGWGSTALPAGLTNDITRIAAGGYFGGSAALRSDGRVVAWGIGSLNGIVGGISNAVGVAAAERFGLALLSDGTVVGFGSAPAVPVGLNNVTAIATGSDHALALRQDGTVVTWGVSILNSLSMPAGLSNVVAISAGGFANAALRADGTAVSWGNNGSGQTSVPAGLSNIIAVASGGFSQLALRRNNWVGDVTVAEDVGAYALPDFATSIVAGPANESGQTVAFLVAHDNASLFSVPPALSPDGTLTFTSATNANGIATVTVRAQDDGGTANGGVDTSAARTFTIAVAAVNDPPAVTFSTSQVVVIEDSGSASMADFASFAGGPANESAQTLAGYALTNDSPALFSVQPALGTNGALTFTPATNAVGTATVTVVALDSGGTAGGGVDRVTNTFVLTIAPVNDPPRITFATDPVVAVPDGGPTNFPGFAIFTGGPVDEAGQAVSVVSVVSDSPVLFTAGGQPVLNGTGELAFEPAAGATGAALVTVVIEDDGGAANGGLNRATNSFTIMVTATRVFVGPLVDTVPNGTLTVPVRLAGTGVEGGVAFTLNYHPGLFSLGSVALGGGAAGATLLTNAAQSAFYGRLGVLVMLPAGTTFAAGDHEVAVVTLNVSASAPATNSMLTFGDAPVRREVTDVSAVPLSNVAFVGGTARVLVALPALEGDVSPRTGGNGLVTVSDVVQVGRFAAGLDTFPIFGGTAEFQRADCAPLATQGDGRISLADWVQAARFAAGLDTPGAPGGPMTQAAALAAAATTKLAAPRRVMRVLGGSLVGGRTNTVTLQLDAQGNEAGVGLSLNFDPSVVTFVRAATGSGSMGGALVVNTSKAAAGKIGILVAMPAGVSLAAGTQDIITLTFNVTGSGRTVMSVGDAPIMREVADVNGIPLLASFVNYVDGAFNILLPAGLKAVGMQRAADGSPRLVVRNSDGTPVTAAQAAKYAVQVTSNLGGEWALLPNALVLEDGALKIVDPAANGAGLRFYRLTESP